MTKAEDVLRGKAVTEALAAQGGRRGPEGRDAALRERLQERAGGRRHQEGRPGPRREMRYSFPKLLELLIGGRGLVLATIVEASGSTPQVPGASAVLSGHGLVAGTVGGGLVEAKAQALALECLRDGRARLAEFRLDADPADQEGAICGGTARSSSIRASGRQARSFETLWRASANGARECSCAASFKNRARALPSSAAGSRPTAQNAGRPGHGGRRAGYPPPRYRQRAALARAR